MSVISTWTSKAASGAALLLLLAGCLNGTGSGSGSAASSLAQPQEAPPARGKVLVQQPLAKGAVIVRGPKGYCIDKRASRPTSGAGFVMLTSCARLVAGENVPRPLRSALLTATTAPGPGPSTAGYSRFIATPEGRAALSQSGNPDALKITHTESRGDLFLIHATDTSIAKDQGLRQETWRGFFDLNGQIISLTAFGFESAPLSIDAGFTLLENFARAIRAASPTVAAMAQPNPLNPVSSDDVARNPIFSE